MHFVGSGKEYKRWYRF